MTIFSKKNILKTHFYMRLMLELDSVSGYDAQDNVDFIMKDNVFDYLDTAYVECRVRCTYNE